MNKRQVAQKIERLKKLINYHRYLYHVEDRQEISEGALDSLKHELYKLEQANPELITADSPTQRVAGKPLDKFAKIRHQTPMLSLEDVFSAEELLAWEDYLRKIIKTKFTYFVELKVDGFAVELIYEKGVLKTGATRGDGLVGEAVTQNIKTIEAIPLKLNTDNLKIKIPDQLVVRGEVYMDIIDFEKLNEGLAKEGKPTYANPRNLAAGSIRQLDAKLAASRPLKFLAYDLITDIGLKSHAQKHEVLASLGFKTDKGKECKDLTEVFAFWKKIEKERDKIPYQIDGVVVNVNDNKFFTELGVIGKSPRGARAFKFSPKETTTKILGVKFQTGRTGAITPVAILAPVTLSGVVISRATLHNAGEIERLGIKIGDTVVVARAGDVIPDVVKVLPELREGKEKTIAFPKYCMVCKSKLEKSETEAIWRCPNATCLSRKRENLYYFASRKAFNIDGLGPRIVDKLVNEGLVFKASDIFKLKIKDLKPLERFADKSAENLIKTIEASKRIHLAKFIIALGIRYVGEETAFVLAQHFISLENLQKAKKEDLENIPDIGPKTAESIYNWLQIKANQALIKDLLKEGVEVLSYKKVKKKLEGKVFVLTGSLDSFTRNQAKERIRLAGGQISESVSTTTSFLIVGNNPGSKLRQANKLGVKIINEKEFIRITTT